VSAVRSVAVRVSFGVIMACSVARAQGASPSASGSAGHCPIVGGFSASVTARDTANSGAMARTLVRVDRRTSVDTTFRIAVAERRWALSELAASAAAGLADTMRGRWYLCAGAAVGLQRPTLVVRGARGEVRVRASLAELSRALEARRSAPTPPGSSPRRS